MSMKQKKILVVNNAEKGITEFYEPFLGIFSSAGMAVEAAEYKELPDLAAPGHGYTHAIMTGSPRGDDIVEHHQPYFQWIKTCDIPVLGICAGHHVTGWMYGSRLMRSEEVEVGDLDIDLDCPEDPLFKGCSSPLKVRQNHHDSITLPPGFVLLAHSDTCKVEAMKHKDRPLYTLQFHPEFLNPEILLNFAAI